MSVICVLAEEHRVGDRNFRDRGNSQQHRNSVASERTASREQPIRMPQASVGRPQMVFVEGPASTAGWCIEAVRVTDCWWKSPFVKRRMCTSSGPGKNLDIARAFRNRFYPNKGDEGVENCISALEGPFLTIPNRSTRQIRHIVAKLSNFRNNK